MTRLSTADTSTCPVYFWKDNEKNGYLCQWYSSAFTAPAHPSTKKRESMEFSSTEQYMMYHKAMTFRDHNVAAQILQLVDPREQKAKGRKVRGFNNNEWNRVREQIVEDGNWWKFTEPKDTAKGQELNRLLLETGDRLLVEASPFDAIWGIGFNVHDAEANRALWGSNLLGQALMRVRNRIREQDEKATVIDSAEHGRP